MGLFDYVRSSYPLLGNPWDQELQTKDLDNAMLHYWIDPAGQLWEINYQTAFNLEINEDAVTPWGRWDWIANGKHGQVIPCSHTTVARMYSSAKVGETMQWAEVNVYIKDGKITEVISKQLPEP